ncbi:heparan-alpha-glucosaminide N-acetyltransferase-like [Venturia canescens]|uniref:heparan-alpha-glucosaminide N-acetyltransferase-like n=1 Tax=Venturia canescens TaxID=32260 RepID=UPI001C9C5ADE|nr:heparan-alpha-glucosaminide N-acetyltransferase-like [Venturia canescens]XP_043274379.1 heparan-alpha-glucosaminide N-acetyltransferase-like [Venturia canescens]XP_043274380.1 heparan-alpha-glucosaminide N-acetyltransferase-like [Venturia canescens]
MNSSDPRCVGPNKTLGIDQACLSILNNQDLPVSVLTYINQCQACDGLPFANLSPNSNTTLVIPTKYEMHLYYVAEKYQWCHGAYKFQEYGHYGWNLTNQSCSWFYTIKDPPTPYMPILAASLVFVALSIFYGVGKFLIPFAMKRLKERRVNEQDDMQDLQDSEPFPPALVVSSRSSTRIHSIDTIRGIAILLMIFVNNGGGKYVFFNHSPWYGFTIADFVLPWFAWIMGLTLVVSLRTQLRISVSRPRIIMRILRRIFFLILFGLIINSNDKTTIENLRFPGVLQLLGITYFICASIEAVFMKAQRNFQYGRLMFLQDILDCWPQWLIFIGIGATHTLVTFLLRVPGCPTGYLGPGGYHLRGKYANCTGGAAGYIDRLLFGSHMYNKTNNPIYGSTLPHDPEGLMNTLSAVLIVALGVQAGRILLCYYLYLQSKILRWFAWAAVIGIIAILLNGKEQEGGVIPVSKNMMTLSFVLATSSFAFFFYIIIFYIVDHKRIWNGAPFVYAGMNPIFLYIGHYLTKGHFPWAWKILNPTHASLLYMNLWTTVLWGFIAYGLYRKNVIITI